jgi:hypothetical protein
VKTPFLCAVRNNHTKLAFELYDNKPKSMTNAKTGGRALVYSARIGNTPLIKLLLANGHNVNYRSSEDDITPLLAAMQSKDKNLVKLLVTIHHN